MKSAKKGSPLSGLWRKIRERNLGRFLLFLALYLLSFVCLEIAEHYYYPLFREEGIVYPVVEFLIYGVVMPLYFASMTALVVSFFLCGCNYDPSDDWQVIFRLIGVFLLVLFAVYVVLAALMFFSDIIIPGMRDLAQIIAHPQYYFMIIGILLSFAFFKGSAEPKREPEKEWVFIVFPYEKKGGEWP